FYHTPSPAHPTLHSFPTRRSSDLRTLTDRCFNEGESLLCEDTSAAVDLRNTAGVAQGTMASIVCALLRTPRRPIGVLHLDRGPQDRKSTRLNSSHSQISYAVFCLK